MTTRKQEWTRFEGSVPWKYIVLDGPHTRRHHGDTNQKVLNVRKNEGVWISDRDPVDTAIIRPEPRKSVVVVPAFTKRFVVGLLNHAVKISGFLFPMKALPSTSGRSTKKEILRQLRLRGFKMHIRLPDIYSVTGWTRYDIQPAKTFIAQHYYNDTPHIERPVASLTEMALIEKPTMLYSPFMTPEEEMAHAKTLPVALSRLRGDHPSRADELEHILYIVNMVIAGDAGAHHPLDTIGFAAHKVYGLDLSPLVYNYVPLTDSNAYALNGIYLYKRYESITHIMHSFTYPETRVIDATNSDDTVDISTFRRPDRLWVSETSSVTIDPNTRFIKLTGEPAPANRETVRAHAGKRLSHFTIYHLVWRRYYEYDTIHVNLPYTADAKGSVRTKSLMTYKVYSNSPFR